MLAYRYICPRCGNSKNVDFSTHGLEGEFWCTICETTYKKKGCDYNVY